VVELFFKQNSSASRQDVRNKLRAIYEQSKNQGFTVGVNSAIGDQQFFYILNEISPNPADPHDPRARKDIEDAAIVVMAYFFEACDIFEEPAKC
jgi:hypothetical protein